MKKLKKNNNKEKTRVTFILFKICTSALFE